jgi:hypothetical protein
MDFIWNEHRNLRGKHSFLSPSGYHWINYDRQKLRNSYLNAQKKEEGTQLHALASELIERRIKVAKLKRTFNIFVNDSIAYGMESEMPLYYSEFCFGTADTISYKDGTLRIFDLKTGDTKASFMQLDIYAALFCLEYELHPDNIIFIERIYQHNEYTENHPDPSYILEIMGRIVERDEWLTELLTEL